MLKTQTLTTDSNNHFGSMGISDYPKFILIGIFGMVFFSAICFAQFHTVCPSGPPQCDFTTIQGALNNAESGDTITVTAMGTYFEHNLRKNRPDISIISNTPSDPGSFIIDGNGNDTVIKMGPGWLLDGFTLTGGLSTDGGAVTYVSDATIRNSIIRNNEATFDGGGFYTITGGSTLTLENTEVHSNIARRGGGGYAASGSLTIIDSKIYDNIASGSAPFGGGIVADVDLLISGSEITNNQVIGGGGHGGGVEQRFQETTTIENSIISGNTVSSGSGGGLRFTGASNGLIDISDSFIQNNSSTTNGGGVELDNGTTVFSNTTISGNNATLDGGGIYCNSSALIGAFDGLLNNNTTNDISANCVIDLIFADDFE